MSAMQDAAREYVASGYTLAAWDRSLGKGPQSVDWGLHPFRPCDVTDHHNVGLNHALSKTAALDADDLVLTRQVLEAFDIDVDALARMTMTWCGNPDNRMKLAFRSDAGLSVKKLSILRNDKEHTVFELRGAAPGKQAQDVLPPSIHPDTRRPYQFITDLRPRDELIELPAALLHIWQNWDQIKPALKRLAGCESVAAAEQKRPPRGDQHGNVIGQFNERFTAVEIIERNGYKKQGKRWMHPDSKTGTAGVIRFDDGCLFSHGGGALADDKPHDAFDCFRILECGSDLRRAVRDAADRLGLPKTAKPARASTKAVTGKLELRLDDKDKIIKDEENVLRVLASDPRLADVVRFNEFASELMLWRPLPSSTIEDVVAERDTPRPWADTDTTAMQAVIQCGIMPGIGRDKVEAAIALHAQRHGRFHPLRDYLQGLQWDQRKRLHGWLADYLGATDKGQPEDFISEIGIRWMVSAVARVMDPGCQVDHLLVLEGPNQGEGKSTALRILAGDANFSDSLPHDLSHKDAKDHTRGKWIIELPELTQFKRNEIETLKAFITRREEVFRPSYGRHEIRAPRQCVFAGTTNESEYLVDTTGNRRFWGVAIGDIDLDALKQDRDQLWAEAAHLYRAGERWHLDRRMEQIAAAESGKRMATDPWAVPIIALIENDHSMSGNELTPGDILTRMDLRESERTPNNAKRVATVLTSLGWRQGRKTNKGRCYVRPRTS